MPPPGEDVVRKRTPADFVFGKVIGEGSFSTVYLAKDVHTNKEFASKSFIFRRLLLKCHYNFSQSPGEAAHNSREEDRVREQRKKSSTNFRKFL